MKTKILMVPLLLFLGTCLSHAQGAWRIYHNAGPAIFTNAAAYGYADGRLAGSNYFCGLYAGADANSLQPMFLGGTQGVLRHLLSENGRTVLFGDFDATVPGPTPVIQFRAWPAAFGTYEQALAADPSIPVGVSALLEPFSSNIILEFPLNTGPIWITSIPEPSALPLLLIGTAVLGGLRKRPLP